MSSFAATQSEPMGVIYDRTPSQPRLIGQALTFCSWLATTLVGAYLTPSSALHGTHQQLGLPPCPSALLFDRPCPGCGLTTSWTALIQGDLAMAFHAHALGPVLYLGYTFVAIVSGIGALKGWRLRSEARWFQATSTVLFSLVLTYGIIRFATTTHYASSWERSYASVPK